MFPRRSEGEESEYPFFEGDGSSSDEWRDYGMAGDDHEGPPVFYDDQYEEESMPVYDTDIEDVIKEEEGFIRSSSMTQTTLNVGFEEDINTKSHELMSFGKSIIIKLLLCSWRFAKILLIIGIRLNQRLLEFPDYRSNLSYLVSYTTSVGIRANLPYHGDSSHDDLVGNSRTNFVYPWTNLSYLVIFTTSSCA
ncbi:hypothetical protein Tco_0492790 [Tanacetum coccineum]